MKLGVPRIWCEPTDHLENCYFCMVVLTNIFDYPDLPSSLRPVKHCEELPVPNCPASVAPASSNSETDDDIVYDLSSIEVEVHFQNLWWPIAIILICTYIFNFFSK